MKKPPRFYFPILLASMLITVIITSAATKPNQKHRSRVRQYNAQKACKLSCPSCSTKWFPSTNFAQAKFNLVCSSGNSSCDYLAVRLLWVLDPNTLIWTEIFYSCEHDWLPCAWNGPIEVNQFLTALPSGDYRYKTAIYNGSDCSQPGNLIQWQDLEIVIP